MNVLLTNDDGYRASGFRVSISAARQAGLIPMIAAPSKGMSGASRSRKSNTVYAWHRYEEDNTDFAFHLDGPPAACVVFAATSGLLPKVDLCISGINAGENLGAELSVSGTFGAALEACSYGMRSIAISREYGGAIDSDPEGWNWEGFDELALIAIRWCLNRDGWLLANVNLPNEPKSLTPVQTEISLGSYFKNFYDTETGRIESKFESRRDAVKDTDDIYAFKTSRQISVTLIGDKIGWT